MRSTELHSSNAMAGGAVLAPAFMRRASPQDLNARGPPTWHREFMH
jgi:hypothetical protein